MDHSNEIKTLKAEAAILQSHNIKYAEAKRKVTKEYIEKVRLILKSKINNSLSSKPINTLAVHVVLYYYYSQTYIRDHIIARDVIITTLNKLPILVID